jgi:hypothetical protein
MDWRITAIALALLLTTCGTEPLTPIPVPPEPFIPIDVTGQPDWILVVVDAALEEWRSHGVPLEMSDEGEIAISGPTPGDWVGWSYRGADGRWHVSVYPGRGYNRACVVARHVGYGLGLEMSKTVGLMYPYLWTADVDCPWSAEDAAGACEATGYCP